MSYVHPITSKGQITLPKEYRDKLGLEDIKKAYITINRDQIIITRPRTAEESLARIQEILAHPAGNQELSEKGKLIGDYLAKKYDVH